MPPLLQPPDGVGEVEVASCLVEEVVPYPCHQLEHQQTIDEAYLLVIMDSVQLANVLQQNHVALP